MRKSRFTEGRIVGVLRKQEAGATTAAVRRRHGIGEQTFYRRKAMRALVSIDGGAATGPLVRGRRWRSRSI